MMKSSHISTPFVFSAALKPKGKEEMVASHNSFLTFSAFVIRQKLN